MIDDGVIATVEYCDETTLVNVIPFNSSQKAEDFEHYYNLRAEAWSQASKDFSEGRIRLTLRDPTLRNQLIVPSYSFRNGKVLVEDKKDIKKRLGSSPDWADCYIMGLWARNQAMNGSQGVTVEQWRALKKEYGYE